MSIDRLPDGAEPLPPPSLAERHEINELMRMVRSYTYPVIFKAHDPHVGTAVLLRHGERLFAFTAAHNIADDTAIHVRLSTPTERTRFGVLDTYIHPQYDPNPPTSKFDLAILELEPTAAVPAGDVSQLYTGAYKRLPDAPPKPSGGGFVWVVGYPAELAKPVGNDTVLYQTAFATQLLGHEPDELTLPYPESVYRMPHDGVTFDLGSTTETPKGYSGGGVWAAGAPKDALFIPHRHFKLIGLQTHWSRTSRLIRCVPGKVMADALKEFRPEL